MKRNDWFHHWFDLLSGLEWKLEHRVDLGRRNVISILFSRNYADILQSERFVDVDKRVCKVQCKNGHDVLVHHPQYQYRIHLQSQTRMLSMSNSIEILQEIFSFHWAQSFSDDSHLWVCSSLERSGLLARKKNQWWISIIVPNSFSNKLDLDRRLTVGQVESDYEILFYARP